MVYSPLQSSVVILQEVIDSLQKVITQSSDQLKKVKNSLNITSFTLGFLKPRIQEKLCGTQKADLYHSWIVDVSYPCVFCGSVEEGL